MQQFLGNFCHAKLGTYPRHIANVPALADPGAWRLAVLADSWRHQHLRNVQRHNKSTGCARCEAVRPGHSVRPKTRLTESETDQSDPSTILRCFLSFKTVVTSRNIKVFQDKKFPFQKTAIYIYIRACLSLYIFIIERERERE